MIISNTVYTTVDNTTSTVQMKYVITYLTKRTIIKNTKIHAYPSTRPLILFKCLYISEHTITEYNFFG